MPTPQFDNLTAPPLVPTGGRTMRPVVQDRYGPVPEAVLGLAEMDRAYLLGEAVAAVRHLLDGHAHGTLVVSVSPGSESAS
jgi:hypothetical protein